MRHHVEVIVRTATLPESKHIDWGNASDRKWLQNHLHWAMMNHHCVTLSRKSAVALAAAGMDSIA